LSFVLKYGSYIFLLEAKRNHGNTRAVSVTKQLSNRKRTCWPLHQSVR